MPSRRAFDVLERMFFMSYRLYADSFSNNSGALDMNHPERHVQNKSAGVRADKGTRKCPLCDTEYSQQNTYCRLDGARLEPTPATAPRESLDLR
jgi:hypothetical protein